jgi:hypothetical protein
VNRRFTVLAAGLPEAGGTFHERSFAMHIPTLSAAASRAALAALVLGWTPGLMAQAPEAGQYQSWSRAIDTLAAKGYPRIEELELRRGGFEADRKSTRLNSSHRLTSRMPSSA